LCLHYYKLLYQWNSPELSYIRFPINTLYLLNYLKGTGMDEEENSIQQHL
jgi:hypothetical protein